MNSNQFDTSLDNLRKIRLASKDKEAIFNTLKGYAANHPVEEKSGVFADILEFVKAALGIRFRF
jgi:hypothetical protein